MSLLPSTLLIVGSLFIFLAALGVYRMPSFLTRMQAASKAAPLGVIFILLGVVVQMPNGETIIKCLGTAMFLLVTTPLVSHCLAKAARERGEQA